MRVYLAGPFFNDVENSFQSLVRRRLEEEGHDVIDPRRHGKADLSSDVDRERILLGNILDIVESEIVVAILDRRNADGKVLRITPADKSPDESFVFNPEPSPYIAWVPDTVSDPISIPDTGTVWEVGYAYACNMPIHGFVSPDVKLNIMLTECLTSLTCTADDLIDAMRHFGGRRRAAGEPVWRKVSTPMEEEG